MPKVFIVSPNMQYLEMFHSEGWMIVDSLVEADLVQFTGGSDVSPSLYGEAKHPRTGFFSARDSEEIKIFEFCLKNSKPMAGICRGGQFLHVMNGGDMWQHVDSHAVYGTHQAFSPDGSFMIHVTSTHHQMMRYQQHVGEVLLYANECKKPKEHMLDDIINYVQDEPDVECMYHEGTRSLCFQPHPEFDNGMQARDFYFRKIFSLFGLKGDV